MGLHGINIISLLIIFLIAVLLFGTKRLRAVIEDLVMAIKNCNKTVDDQKEMLLSKKSKSEKLDGD